MARQCRPSSRVFILELSFCMLAMNIGNPRIQRSPASWAPSYASMLSSTSAESTNSGVWGQSCPKSPLWPEKSGRVAACFSFRIRIASIN